MKQIITVTLDNKDKHYSAVQITGVYLAQIEDELGSKPKLYAVAQLYAAIPNSIAPEHIANELEIEVPNSAEEIEAEIIVRVPKDIKRQDIETFEDYRELLAGATRLYGKIIHDKAASAHHVALAQVQLPQHASLLRQLACNPFLYSLSIATFAAGFFASKHYGLQLETKLQQLWEPAKPTV
jgi:hypothetical protein